MRAFLLTILITVCSSLVAQTFIAEQLRYARVRAAKEAVDSDLRRSFVEKGLHYPPTNIFIRALKSEKELEVWVKESEGWKHFKTYSICRLSGKPGPKRKEGDGQVPEGFYHISSFNPFSNFHLSMQINYPNTSDQELGDPDRPGGLIYIHGACVTIGCIPITDAWIKELYWLSVQAKSRDGSLPVHIFPFRMNRTMMQWARNLYGEDQKLLTFWDSLLPGYQQFETGKQVIEPTTDESGYYSFQ